VPPSIAARQLEPEWMDEPGIDPALHRAALRGLERINRTSRTVPALWAPVAGLLQQHPRASLLDVACGAGDVAIGLARRARAKGSELEVEGCDVSPTAVAYATRQSQRRGANVRFFEHDVLRTPLARTYDVVICSLFVHHLHEEQAMRLLRTLDAAARSLVIVSDLDRSRVGLILAWLGTRLLTRSPVVHVDSLRSVHAAFTRQEAAALAGRAGLRSVQITAHWPCRWRLVAQRSS
jgi:2-polyprenyl-3-methyl-5-hydroxy-6-metoxy-1,4-benzoquinol methylase